MIKLSVWLFSLWQLLLLGQSSLSPYIRKNVTLTQESMSNRIGNTRDIPPTDLVPEVAVHQSLQSVPEVCPCPPKQLSTYSGAVTQPRGSWACDLRIEIQVESPVRSSSLGHGTVVTEGGFQVVDLNWLYRLQDPPASSVSDCRSFFEPSIPFSSSFLFAQS